MRILSAFAVLLLSPLVIACHKSIEPTNCHVVCVSIYPGIQLWQMDSTETDTMYFKAFAGDGDFSIPVYTHQLNEKELGKLYMSPDSSYELDIPAISKVYRIKNIRIDINELDYVGYRCNPTICKSYPQRPIVNNDSADLIQTEFNIYVLLRK